MFGFALTKYVAGRGNLNIFLSAQKSNQDTHWERAKILHVWEDKYGYTSSNASGWGHKSPDFTTLMLRALKCAHNWSGRRKSNVSHCVKKRAPLGCFCTCARAPSYPSVWRWVLCVKSGRRGHQEGFWLSTWRSHYRSTWRWSARWRLPRAPGFPATGYDQ